MTQVGESVKPGVITPKPPKQPKALAVALLSITFDSGIKLFEVVKGGGENELPPAGTPHWKSKNIYPAVYVREGGKGETKDLVVQAQWAQQGLDGSAKLKGSTRDGSIVIEGDFSISGARGKADVSCTFTKRPDKVTNLGGGVPLRWQVTAGGTTVDCAGGSPVRLFFVDAKPLPIGWPGSFGYKAHYLRVVDWATRWAAGKAGEKDVLAALWSKFSDGKGAQVPHVTGFAYWKSNDPVQDLKTLVSPDSRVYQRGWSCRAIAHTFMECLALNGIQCTEVVPEAPADALMFLVQNWDVAATPLPNWNVRTDLYYAGTWLPSKSPPLNKPIGTSLTQDHGPSKTLPKLKVDMRKRAGVPAQGQPLAPLGFSNHWIVLVGGKLYDTSYGGMHANSMTTYATASLAGWLVGTLADTTVKTGWLKKEQSRAWLAHEVGGHSLDRSDGASN
ncbi:MAG: hypothetical protein HZC37_13435 [Burkholderiales bacterium]|nr:hypothetical protein [Burkholderiales bacterium]